MEYRRRNDRPGGRAMSKEDEMSESRADAILRTLREERNINLTPSQLRGVLCVMQPKGNASFRAFVKKVLATMPDEEGGQ